MKKRLISVFLCVVMMMALVAGCSSDKEEAVPTDSKKQTEEKGNPMKVVLNEVAHSIFYAPMYVAIEEGYFAEEGIELDLVTGFWVHQLVQDTL